MTDLPHHAVPHVIDLFAVLAVGYQVKVVSELHIPGNLLQDVYTEALTYFTIVSMYKTCVGPLLVLDSK